MVTRLTLSVCLLSLLTAGTLSQIAQAQEDHLIKSTIRFYKINKHQQTTKIRISKRKTKQPGCHNFKRATPVYNAIQTGYMWCQLFTQKNCADGSSVNVSHSKSDTYTQRLSQGYAWQPISLANNATDTQTNDRQQGLKIRSWSCN